MRKTPVRGVRAKFHYTTVPEIDKITRALWLDLIQSLGDLSPGYICDTTTSHAGDECKTRTSLVRGFYATLHAS